MQKLILFSFICISLFVTNVSQSQVNTPPLSPEEAEVIKPLQKFVECWYKRDIELCMSTYHEKAVIVTASGAKVDKKGLRRIFASGMGDIHMSYNVEKIEITGDKATIECIMKWGSKDIPRKIDLVKQGDVWLVIGYWLR
ncbi:MAG: nuclear transport factor 2 family protein [Thermodesulfobacteriota bacterium]|nr:nuclear transport factor 2 family protein [Thermodesulfobacteriota bacterium]